MSNIINIHSGVDISAAVPANMIGISTSTLLLVMDAYSPDATAFHPLGGTGNLGLSNRAIGAHRPQYESVMGAARFSSIISPITGTPMLVCLNPDGSPAAHPTLDPADVGKIWNNPGTADATPYNDQVFADNFIAWLQVEYPAAATSAELNNVDLFGRVGFDFGNVSGLIGDGLGGAAGGISLTAHSGYSFITRDATHYIDWGPGNTWGGSFTQSAYNNIWTIVVAVSGNGAQACTALQNGPRDAKVLPTPSTVKTGRTTGHAPTTPPIISGTLSASTWGINLGAGLTAGYGIHTLGIRNYPSAITAAELQRVTRALAANPGKLLYCWQYLA